MTNALAARLATLTAATTREQDMDAAYQALVRRLRQDQTVRRTA